MKEAVAEKIKQEVESLDDVKTLSNKYGASPGAVLSLLLQKKIDESKRNFGKVAAKRNLIYRNYKRGMSFVELAKEFQVPPISILWTLRDKLNLTKKQVRSLVRNPKGNSRLAREMKQAIDADFLQSPWGLSFMRWKGKTGEKLTSMLISVDHLTEDEIEEGRTPDFLLSEPMELKGRKVRWIESKATFADSREFNYNKRRQLDDYVKIFGHGAVIYWLGKTESVKSDGMLVLSGEDVKPMLPQKGIELYWELQNRMPAKD